MNGEYQVFNWISRVFNLCSIIHLLYKRNVFFIMKICCNWIDTVVNNSKINAHEMPNKDSRSHILIFSPIIVVHAKFCSTLPVTCLCRVKSVWHWIWVMDETYLRNGSLGSVPHYSAVIPYYLPIKQTTSSSNQKMILPGNPFSLILDDANKLPQNNIKQQYLLHSFVFSCGDFNFNRIKQISHIFLLWKI